MAAEALLFMFLQPDLGCDQYPTESLCLRLTSPYNPAEAACSWDIARAVPCAEAEPDPDVTFYATANFVRDRLRQVRDPM